MAWISKKTIDSQTCSGRSKAVASEGVLKEVREANVLSCTRRVSSVGRDFPSLGESTRRCRIMPHVTNGPVGWGCWIHRLHLCRGLRHSSNECPRYDAKQSDGEVPVMLELCGMRSPSSLLSVPGPLWSAMVAPDRVLSMGQIELNSVLRLNWIIWNRTIYMYKHGFSINNLQWLCPKTKPETDRQSKESMLMMH